VSVATWKSPGLNGMSGPEIIFKELMPTCYRISRRPLVASVSAAILASIGLEVLGLGRWRRRHSA